MNPISKMTFDECLAELQGILHTIKTNGGRSTKGTSMRKSLLAEALIKIDLKKFFEIFPDQVYSFSYLIIRKAVHESPILLYESLQKAPDKLGFALGLIDEVKPLSLRKKQIDVIVTCLKSGMSFSYLSHWDDLFKLLEIYKPEAINDYFSSWLGELSNSNTYKTKNKIEQAENFLNKYIHLLSDTSKNHLDICIEDYKKQIKLEQIAQNEAYVLGVKNALDDSIKNLSEFTDSVTDEFIESQKTKDLENKEELLSYDMEFTNDLYQSLGKDVIFIAHGDDEMQYESSPFYVLYDIQRLLYNLDDFFNSNDLELDLNELIKLLKHAGEKRFARFIDGYDPADYGFESGWLDEIAWNVQNEWEGGYAGKYSYYFINEKEYTITVSELKQVCLILVEWAEKIMNR